MAHSTDCTLHTTTAQAKTWHKKLPNNAHSTYRRQAQWGDIISKDDSDYLAFKETTWSYCKFVYRSTFLCKSVSTRSQPIQICCTTITNMQTKLRYVHLYQWLNIKWSNWNCVYVQFGYLAHFFNDLVYGRPIALYLHDNCVWPLCTSRQVMPCCIFVYCTFYP